MIGIQRIHDAACLSDFIIDLVDERRVEIDGAVQRSDSRSRSDQDIGGDQPLINQLLEAGDFASVPPGVPHTFTNVHKDRPVTMVDVVTPGGFHKALHDASKLEMPPSPEALKPMEAAHNFTVVGPPIAVKLGLVG